MNWAQIYKDVQREKAFLEIRIEDLEGEYNYWYRNLQNGYRKPVADMETCLKRMDQIKEHCIEYEYLLKIKTNTMEQMDKQLEGMKDIVLEVMKLREFENMSVHEVSRAMHISEIYVKKISREYREKLVI